VEDSDLDIISEILSSVPLVDIPPERRNIGGKRDQETVAKRGRSGRLDVGCGVPAVDVVVELVVEDSGADLGSRWAPFGLQRICCFLVIRFAMT